MIESNTLRSLEWNTFPRDTKLLDKSILIEQELVFYLFWRKFWITFTENNLKL